MTSLLSYQSCFKGFIHKTKREIRVHENIYDELKSMKILWILKRNQFFELRTNNIIIF